MSALGQTQRFALQEPMSALLPTATAKADFRKRSCPLCPPKVDVCGAASDVCFGPIADIDYSITSESPSSYSRH
jgi:hypothetical protein